jgi:hypothetical protein
VVEAKSAQPPSPRAKPLEIKKGSVRVRIYAGRKDFAKGGKDYAYAQYSVCYYNGAQRIRKRFSDLGQAKDFAQTAAQKLALGHHEALRLSPADAAIYVRAIDQLKPLNLPLNVTPIKEKLAVNAVFELPETNRWVVRLRDQVDRYLATATNFTNGPVGVLDVDYWIFHAEPKSNAPPSKLVVVRPKRFNNEFLFNADQNAGYLLDSLMNPNLQMTVCREPSPGTSFENLYETLPFLLNASLAFKTNEFSLYYALPSKRLLAHWQYQPPISTLSTPAFTLSLHDVAKAYCYFKLIPDKRYNISLRPFIVDVQFDSYPSMTMESFKPSNMNDVYEAIIPPENEVQHRLVSRFFMPYALTSKLFPR